MDRRELGSWLSGPITALGPDVGDQEFRGQSLGLPPSGPGSVAGFGRRVAALFIDWLLSIGLVTIFSGGQLGFAAAPGNATPSAFWTLGVFFLQICAFTWLAQASIGQRLMGIGVADMSGGRVGLLRAVVRTGLICLVIPPVIYDRDARGLHDRAALTIVLRAR
jgi:uncharacterized RDD family membrane protein YckC